MAESEGRLAKLLGALSLACDAAFGYPAEKVMRSAVLGVELGRRCGLPPAQLRDVYFASVLQYAGCTAFSHEEARYGGGDDIAMRNALAHAMSDPAPGAMSRVVRQAGKGTGFAGRIRAVARLAIDMSSTGDRHAHSLCETSVRLADMLRMSEGVRTSLRQICERWDGKGHPNRTAADEIALPMRLAHIGDFAETAHHRAGRPAALALVEKQSGRLFDPSLAGTFLEHAEELFESIEGDSIWERFLAAEPSPHALVDAQRFEDVAQAFARVADLKSVWTLGHSTGVAALAVAAAGAMGLSDDEQRLLLLGALLHDIGRLGVPNSVWDKPGSLSPSEWELVYMHSYWTERVLSRTPMLARLGELAGAAHERLDGAGYHRSLPPAMLSRAARILAAADVYHALREPRPHRPAHGSDDAARLVLEEVAGGRLDRHAAEAVLDVAGYTGKRVRSAWPCGLSDREVAVLRLVARGHTNKGIAKELGISPRTVQHHVVHIYQKIDVSSRAAVALFATEHGLLDVLATSGRSGEDAR